LKRVRLIGETSATNVAKARWGGEGCTLGSYRADAANGVDLRYDDPWGGWHTISLTPFADQDPDRWLLFFCVESRDDGTFPPEPALDRGAAILKEFDFPADAEPPTATPRDYDGDGTLLKKYELQPGLKSIIRADLRAVANAARHAQTLDNRRTCRHIGEP
jgi:hypothetical protein